MYKPKKAGVVDAGMTRDVEGVVPGLCLLPWYLPVALEIRAANSPRATYLLHVF